MYDQRAEKIEEWAGVLHDHPISEAFSAAHPELEVNPESMVRMEEDADRARIKAEYSETRKVNIEIKPFSDSWRVEKLLDRANSAKAEEWQALSDKAEELAGQFNEFVNNLVQEVEVKPARNQAAALNSIIESVRSGRASEG